MVAALTSLLAPKSRAASPKKNKTNSYPTHIEIKNEDTLDMALRFMNSGSANTMVLNMASDF